jgi:nitrite reductase (NADH) small subunit
MAEFVRVAALADIKPGHGIVAEAHGKTLAVFNVDGTIHAISNTCCHREGPLGEGELESNIVTCHIRCLHEQSIRQGGRLSGESRRE